MLTTDELIEQLNEDLSDEYAAIIQYTTLRVPRRPSGPFPRMLAAFSAPKMADEQRQRCSWRTRSCRWAARRRAARCRVLGRLIQTNRDMLLSRCSRASGAPSGLTPSAATRAEQFGDRGLRAGPFDDMVPATRRDPSRGDRADAAGFLADLAGRLYNGCAPTRCSAAATRLRKASAQASGRTVVRASISYSSSIPAASCTSR